MSEPDHPKQPNETRAPTVEAQEAAFADAGKGAPPEAPEASPDSEPEAPQSAAPGPEQQLQTARQEAAQAQDRYLRAVADLENFRRRTVREKDDLRAYAAGRAVEELLPVLDNITRALGASKEPNATLETLVGGLEMVATQLKSALGNLGVKEIDPAGEPFDPNLHEALSQQPSAEVPEGHVLQVVRVGYSLNGRLLRPASVLVSGGAPQEEAKG